MSTAPTAPDAPGDVRREIAPSGTLHAAINFNNPLLSRRDATGALQGVAVDISEALGRRLDLPVKRLPYDAAGRISADARSGRWDVAFLAIDPVRAVDIDFTSAYLELEGTYLVPTGSAVERIEDADQAGVRIGVTANSAYDLFLSRTLRHAVLVRFATTPMSIDELLPQKLDAVAAVRTALVANVARVPGAKVLGGHFMTIPQATGLPKGRPAATRYVSGFMEELKASGFVAAALERHGLGPDDALVASLASAATASGPA